MKISRRDALRSALLGGLATGVSACATTGTRSAADLSGAQFLHGVASGEPATDGFLIWSRITPPAGTSGTAELTYDVATDVSFTDVISSGTVETGAYRDWTLKADVKGLKPGQRYFYRFQAGNITSPTGRSRTLPEGSVESARFAAVSCSNYAFGFFNVYDAIAKRDDIDAVIHLGDYIYE